MDKEKAVSDALDEIRDQLESNANDQDAKDRFERVENGMKADPVSGGWSNRNASKIGQIRANYFPEDPLAYKKLIVPPL